MQTSVAVDKEWELPQQIKSQTVLISSPRPPPVAREMATTFARLCQQVDQTQKELEAEIRRLTAKIDQLERVQSHSKTLRSVEQPVWWPRIASLVLMVQGRGGPRSHVAEMYTEVILIRGLLLPHGW